MNAPGSTYHPSVAPSKAAQKRTKIRAEHAWNMSRQGRQMNLEQVISEVEQEAFYALLKANGEAVNDANEGDEPDTTERE